MVTTEPAGLREFIAGRFDTLLRRAWVLTGDWAAAEDLVQDALAMVWPRWEKIEPGARESYLRTTMMRVFLARKKRWWSRELPTAAPPESATVPDLAESVSEAMDLRALLATLSARQRAVLVLRYMDDQTEEQTARVLGCSVGTVKTHARRAIQLLRALDETATRASR